MPRLIDADVLVSILNEWENLACDGTEDDGSDGTTRVLHPVPTTTSEMIDLIADQPTIEALPVQHGQWIPKPVMVRHPYARNWYCSECRHEPLEKTEYCPCCLAKMDGEKE